MPDMRLANTLEPYGFDPLGKAQEGSLKVGRHPGNFVIDDFAKGLDPPGLHSRAFGHVCSLREI